MTPRHTPARVAPGRLPGHTYRRRDGKPLCPVAIGQHVVTLNHRDRTVAGTVPPSWRVDLNADHPDDVAQVAPAHR